jgi:hypothetical protein
MQQAQKAEPSSRTQHAFFLIGQDRRGNWVARDQSGIRGGLFVDRAGALKFARDENGNHPPAVELVSGILELDAISVPEIAPQKWRADEIDRRRRTA